MDAKRGRWVREHLWAILRTAIIILAAIFLTMLADSMDQNPALRRLGPALHIQVGIREVTRQLESRACTQEGPSRTGDWVPTCCRILRIGSLIALVLSVAGAGGIRIF